MLSQFPNQLFGLGVSVKNALYDKGILPSHRLPAKVVSVGNISVGGTGKTSFVIWLMQTLTKKGLSVGVVSRGYGGSVKGISQVPVSADPEIYGDEPCLIANECLGPVFIGADRVKAGQKLFEHYPVDVIVADDAFQHRRLYRDLDVVLVDLSSTSAHRQLLPLGRLRESFSSLRRADVVVKTKKNFSEPMNAKETEDLIPKDILTLEMDYGLKSVKHQNGNDVNRDQKFLLVSGVAQPKGVESLAKAHLEIADHLQFADHHPYSKNDVHDILTEMNQQRVSKILTTPKDGVKLAKFKELEDHLCLMELEYLVRGPTDEFIKKIIG